MTHRKQVYGSSFSHKTRENCSSYFSLTGMLCALGNFKCQSHWANEFPDSFYKDAGEYLCYAKLQTEYWVLYLCWQTSSTRGYLGRRTLQRRNRGKLGGIFYALMMTKLMQTCIIVLKSKELHMLSIYIHSSL